MSRLLHVVLAAWLVLALPFGQHGALVHALGHATDEAGSGGKAPGPEQCIDHSLYTPFAGAVGSAVACMPIVSQGAAVITSVDSSAATAGAPHAYLSRAPPAAPARR